MIILVLTLFYKINQDIVEDEESRESKFGIVSKGSRIGLERDGSGKDHKFQRKGTITRVRDSVRNTRNGTLSRGNSVGAVTVSSEGRADKKREEGIQLEEITVIN